MEKGNSFFGKAKDFINKHKKGCINAASILMCVIIAGIKLRWEKDNVKNRKRYISSQNQS